MIHILYRMHFWKVFTFFIIQAEDPDTMDQGKLTYKLLPESMYVYAWSLLQYFSLSECMGLLSAFHSMAMNYFMCFRLNVFDVDPVSGTVFVKNGAVLDRESRSLYTATLQARDTDNKPGSTVLEITLTDINDQPPVINREYLENVKEGKMYEYRIEVSNNRTIIIP